MLVFGAAYTRGITAVFIAISGTTMNQMIIIHTTLDISLFYINYQQRQARDGYV